MPNWCEGRLKLKGSMKNIIKFFESGIGLTESDKLKGVNISSVVKIEKGDDCCAINIFDLVYIKGTGRAFINPKYVWLGEAICTVSVSMMQAYDVSPEEFLSIAKEYGIDIRIQAFEKGMEFSRDVEIIGGKITKNETIKYNDYIWDCPVPDFGG